MKLETKVEIEYSFVNIIQKSVSLGINPLKAVNEAYQYTQEAKQQGIEDEYEIMQYATKKLEDWYSEQ